MVAVLLALSLYAPRFPHDNVWNKSVHSLAVHPQSHAWIARWARDTVGFTISPSPRCGIPVNLIGSAPTTIVKMAWQQPMALPWGPWIRVDACGGPAPGWAAVDTVKAMLYEVFAMSSRGDSAGSACAWDLRSNALRPAVGLQASESGMPFAPGLLFYQEAHEGRIRHALKMDFEWEAIADSAIWPARGFAVLKSGGTIPLGSRIRLRADYPIPDTLGVECRAILQALQTYGAFISDRAGTVPDTGNGQMNLWACPDPRWGGVLAKLGRVTVGISRHLEFVDESKHMAARDSARWKTRHWWWPW